MTAGRERKKPPPLKIATFNINGIRSRLPALLAWLRDTQPDIVCLQELKCRDEAFPHSEIAEAGYGAAWHGQSSWNGVAILVRDGKPEVTRIGLPGDARDTQSRYLEAVARGVIVGCLYLPNGNPQPGPKFVYKLKWTERLIAHAAGFIDQGLPMVLAGDFNIVPTDNDIYNTRSWLKNALLQPEPREQFARLLDQGWTDSLKAHFGDAAPYTFWDYFRRHWDTDSGLRIDHLLLSPALAPRLSAAGVDREVRGQPHASDHAPVWIELDMAKKAARATRARAPRKKASGGRSTSVKKRDVRDRKSIG